MPITTYSTNPMGDPALEGGGEPIHSHMVFGFKRLRPWGIWESTELGESPGQRLDLLLRHRYRPNCVNCGAPFEITDGRCSYCLSGRMDP